MSKIDKHNYEAFYLDYLEGNLGEELTAQLLLFLEENPDLKAELEGFEIIELKADTEVEFDKDSIRQTINESNVEAYIIASIENEIDPDDVLELEEYLKNSSGAKILEERYKKTILPKQKILFPEKEKLKKKSTTIYYLAPLVAAAAVALIFLVFNPLDTIENQPDIVHDQKRNDTVETPVIEIKTVKIDAIAELKAAEQTSKNAISENGNRNFNNQGSMETTPEVSPGSEEIDINVLELVKMNPRTLKTFPGRLQISSVNTDRLAALITIAENELIEVEETQLELKTNTRQGRKVNLWSLADLGLRVYSKLNERNYAVQQHYSASGEVQSVTLITDKRRITAPAI